jgi:hypothetical protein
VKTAGHPPLKNARIEPRAIVDGQEVRDVSNPEILMNYTWNSRNMPLRIPRRPLSIYPWGRRESRENPAEMRFNRVRLRIASVNRNVILNYSVILNLG